MSIRHRQSLTLLGFLTVLFFGEGFSKLLKFAKVINILTLLQNIESSHFFNSDKIFKSFDFYNRVEKSNSDKISNRVKISKELSFYNSDKTLTQIKFSKELSFCNRDKTLTQIKFPTEIKFSKELTFYNSDKSLTEI